VKDDNQFSNSIRTFFIGETFIQVVHDFGLNFTSLGNCKPEELIIAYRLETPYQSGGVDKYKTEDVKLLSNPNNSTAAFFLNYNGHLELDLSEVIRTNKMYIKPFIGDQGQWSPTNGNTYCQIYLSSDRKNWDYITVIPSSYGNSSNDYIQEISFNSFYSFQHIKFSSTSSSIFSLAYLSFTKLPTVKKADNKKKK